MPCQFEPQAESTNLQIPSANEAHSEAVEKKEHLSVERRQMLLNAWQLAELAYLHGTDCSQDLIEQVMRQVGLLPVSWTPRLGVFMEPEVANATTEVRA